MSTNRFELQEVSQELNDDEWAIIDFCRALHIDKEEALKRLSTPSCSLHLLYGQELAANLSSVDSELSQSQPDPVALSGHENPTCSDRIRSD